jgi:hypothetical protein
MFTLSQMNTVRAFIILFTKMRINIIQVVPGGKVSILGSHSIGHSKQKSAYVHVSYSERFPR